MSAPQGPGCPILSLREAALSFPGVSLPPEIGDPQKPGGSQEGELRETDAEGDGLELKETEAEGDDRELKETEAEGDDRELKETEAEGDGRKLRETEAAQPLRDGGEVEATAASQPVVTADNCSGPWPDFPMCEPKMEVSFKPAGHSLWAPSGGRYIAEITGRLGRCITLFGRQ